MEGLFQWGLTDQTEARILWSSIGFWLAMLVMKNLDDKNENYAVWFGAVFSVLFIFCKIYQ